MRLKQRNKNVSDDDQITRQDSKEKRMMAFTEHTIRQSMRSGEFENLEGAGKPLPGLDQPYDELWWVKKLIEREKLSVLPASLQIRRDIEQKLNEIWKLSSEKRVREEIEALNANIKKLNSTVTSGPTTNLAPLDIEQIVERWHDLRKI